MMGKFPHRAWLAWAALGLLAAMCGILAILQYRWIGEIAGAERTRLHEELQLRLNTFSRTLNQEITAASQSLVPSADDLERLGREGAYSAQFVRWKETHEKIFRHLALGVPEEDTISLLMLNLDTAQYTRADWPPEWSGMLDRLLQRRRGGPLPPMPPGSTALFELPRFRTTGREPGRPEMGPPDRRGRNMPPLDGGRETPPPGHGGSEATPPDRRGAEARGRGGPEAEWLIMELDLDYMAGALLPQWVNRYLAGFEAKVVDARDPSIVIYDSAPNLARTRNTKPDAVVALLDIRPIPSGRGGRGGFGPGPPPDGGQGNWRLLVWNQAGSLEALVARTRRRNLAISAGILLLILTAVSTLLRLSRKAQQLAEQQINFVAGVSHELRTPLTVIRTAAFNLQGKLAARPESVSRYGALIQAETEKLAALVEQVLRSASTQAGHVIRAREPFRVETLIEEGLESSQAGLEGSSLIVEKHIDPNLPLVMADGLAMRHALQNLVDNALKYGTEGSNWIGMFASAVTGENGAAVEIRVADHGPGIPLDEQKHIFDPFFRGRRAVQDQVHGTGLGLNLVKRIVEAHGGSIRVHSQPMQGTEFVIRIPAAPPELQNELTHSFN